MSSTIVCMIYSEAPLGHKIQNSIVDFCRSHGEISISSAIIQPKVISSLTTNTQPTVLVILENPPRDFATQLKASIASDSQYLDQPRFDYIEGERLQLTVAVISGTIA